MWLALALLSFAAFLVSAFAFTRLGFTREGQFQRAGVPLLVGTLLLLGLWVFALPRVAPPYPLENLKRYQAPQ